MPFTVREGINIFLSGFVPTENMRFREEELTFKISDTFEDMKMDKTGSYKYPQVSQ
jgi:ATP-binding cassette subfamily E protein 1